MVEDKPASGADAPQSAPQAAEIAERLRDGLTPKPTQADSTTAVGTTQANNKTDLDTALNQINALSFHPTASASEMLADKLAESKSVSFLDNEVQNSVGMRRTVAFVEGGAYALPGAVKAIADDVTHPGQLAEKGLTAATIGLAMRVLLPKTGAGKAIVGAVMGYYMVKDAVKPIINGWEESGKAKNMDQVNKAAQHIGDGLGAFAWDAWFGSKVGLKAEKFTGAALDLALPTEKFAAFEKFKVNVDNTLITKPLTSLLSPLTRASEWASDKMVRKPDEVKIEFQAVKHQFAEVEAKNVARIQSVDLHLKGVLGADNNRLGFSETLDLLQKGHDPRKVASTQVHELLGTNVLDYPGNRVGGVQTIQEALNAQGGRPSIVAAGDGSAAGSNQAAIIGPADLGGQGDSARGRRGPKGGDDAAQPPDGDNTAGAVARPPTKPYVTKAEKEINAQNLGRLAAMNKTVMDAWTDKRVLIEDAKERFAGPVHAAITPEYKAMDPGYILPRNQMMAIAGQLSSEGDLKYVMPLFSRFSMASTQHISDGLTTTASLKYQLDLMALETHSELVRNMKKAGIDPDKVLRSKNPAVFSISHDGGAGPHTMRQIDGVWNVDHVLYPRNMVDTRSVTASGIYSHELQHDQYGGILKFDESIRSEQVIADAVAKGPGATRANEKIHMPGKCRRHITKQQLLEAIFKAHADENTADIGGAAWTGHNSGGALGILLQSLRKGGELETRNVFGTEFKADDNPYGFEPHAFDALRPKIVASVMRAWANLAMVTPRCLGLCQRSRSLCGRGQQLG